MAAPSSAAIIARDRMVPFEVQVSEPVVEKTFLGGHEFMDSLKSEVCLDSRICFIRCHDQVTALPEIYILANLLFEAFEHRQAFD